MKQAKKKGSWWRRSLGVVERVGNRLPHPITLFAALTLLLILLSALCAALGVSATGEWINPSTLQLEERTVTAVSLLSRDGVVYMLTHMVSNFTGFAPLGVVLVTMLGVGCAEGSGYLAALLKKLVRVTPRRIVTPALVFLGVMSNIATDIGYVILLPVGALVFLAYGRHPLAGLAATFAGVSGGFSANLLIGALDPLLAGISTEAAQMVDGGYVVQPTANWYFLMVSTLVIVAIGTLVTDKLVEPRLGAFSPAGAAPTKPETGKSREAGSEVAKTEDTAATANGASLGAADAAAATETVNADATDAVTADAAAREESRLTALSARESKALKAATAVLFVLLLLLVIAALPRASWLRNPVTGSLTNGAPLMDGLVVLLALLFFVPSVVYGRMAGKYRGEKDIAKQLETNMRTMGSYIALIFVAAQFVNFFHYSQLGTILAISGSQLLQSSGISGPLLMVLFVLFTALLNLLMGSATAKWTILAPIFIPMFMMLGYSPELTQVAYRIGDSCTNLITPLMSYFAMVVVFAKKYDSRAGIGTLISTMMPYSLCFLVGWTLLLVLWMWLGWPLGPGALPLLG